MKCICPDDVGDPLGRTLYDDPACKYHGKEATKKRLAAIKHRVLEETPKKKGHDCKSFYKIGPYSFCLVCNEEL